MNPETPTTARIAPGTADAAPAADEHDRQSLEAGIRGGAAIAALLRRDGLLAEPQAEDAPSKR